MEASGKLSVKGLKCWSTPSPLVPADFRQCRRSDSTVATHYSQHTTDIGLVVILSKLSVKCKDFVMLSMKKGVTVEESIHHCDPWVQTKNQT